MLQAAITATVDAFCAADTSGADEIEVLNALYDALVTRYGDADAAYIWRIASDRYDTDTLSLGNLDDPNVCWDGKYA